MEFQCDTTIIYEENQCVFKFGGEEGEGDDEKEGEEGVERAAQGGVGGHGEEEEEEEEQEEEQEAYVAEVVEGDVFEEASLSQRRRCQNSSSGERMKGRDEEISLKEELT